MSRTATSIIALAASSFAGCSPAIDWREFVPEGTDITVSFPCRPDRHVRNVALAVTRVKMEMLSCSVGDTTFALAFVDVAEPAYVGAALSELRTAAARNLQGLPQTAPLQIKGMTPNEHAARTTIAGRLPDGSTVQQQAAFFARGMRVYQAIVIGARLVPQDVDAFIGGLKFSR